MHVTRLDSAPAYDAPGHAGMRMLRLQGREAGPADQLWLGLSTLLPGGGTRRPAACPGGRGLRTRTRQDGAQPRL